MRIFGFLGIIAIAWGSPLCSAKTVTDTLVSPKNDRIIVSYDLIQNNGRFIVRFNNVQKRLGAAYSKKYRKLSEIVPMFFDRTGGYENVKFEGLTPEAFMKPSKVGYIQSEDGYFSFQDNPAIALSLKSDESAELSIPIYLTHYEKKGRYYIFSRCGNLKILLEKEQGSSSSDSSRLITQTVISTTEPEEDNSHIIEALTTVERVMDLLVQEDRLPFSENLGFEITQLRGMRNRVKDAATLQRINDALDAYDSKKRELKEVAEASAAAARVKAEMELQKAQELEQARADSIAAAAQMRADKEKKRNIWMIMGGGVLAILCFVGNQVFQHFRNIKSQKSMMEMQQQVIRRAENEAKRRARSYAHNKAHQAKNVARNSAREVLKGVKKKSGDKRNPGNISI